MRIASLKGVLIVAACLAAHVADAGQMFIEEFYSNADGSEQFIVLEYSGPPATLVGRAIVFRSGNKQSLFTFPANLQGAAGPENGLLVIATQAFADHHAFKPDFVMAAGTLLVPDGSIEGEVEVDQYSGLASDNTSAVFATFDPDFGNYTNGFAPGFAVNHSGDALALAPIPRVHNVEYYNASLDDYFVTAFPDEIAALDGGMIPGWTRTNEGFDTWSGPAADLTLIPQIQDVCRIYVGGSHFFSLALFPTGPDSECVAALKQQGALAETWTAFHATAPDAAGACPTGQVPVYRLWNPHGTAHRLTTHKSDVLYMFVELGWLPEGFGEGVVMCVPGPA